MATSVTGVGELIMRAALAREAARGIAAGDADVDAACSAVIEDTILQVRQFAKCICELHLQQSPFYIGVFRICAPTQSCPIDMHSAWQQL